MTGGKSKPTYPKVSKAIKKKGDSAWAKAKNGEGDHNYAAAKKFYNTAEEARKKSE